MLIERRHYGGVLMLVVALFCLTTAQDVDGPPAGEELAAEAAQPQSLEEEFDALSIQANPSKSEVIQFTACLLYTSPSPRDRQKSRMPSSA